MIKFLKDDKNLIQLYKENHYDDFCKKYEKEFKKNPSVEFDIDKFEDFINLEKYLQFILNKQKDNYDISYINWLVKNKFSNKVIQFFESIKNAKNNVITSEIANCSELLETICIQKNIELFKYFYDNDIKRLDEQKDLEILIPFLIDNEFIEALDYLKNIQDFKLMVIDELVYKLKKDKKESGFASWNIYFNILSIENKKEFQDLIEDYVARSKMPVAIRNVSIRAEAPRYSTGLLMNSTSGIEPVRDQSSLNYYYNKVNSVSGVSGSSKSKVNMNKLQSMMKKQSSIYYKTDNIAQTLLNKYLMESSLLEKTTTNEKSIKI